MAQADQDPEIQELAARPREATLLGDVVLFRLLLKSGR